VGPRFFTSANSIEKWFASNHHKKKELLVGFHKVKSGKKSINYQEALDAALCYGWIDGIRKSIDDSSYTIRFTPRKKNSIWSQRNIKRMTFLKDSGKMQEAGWDVFASRDENKTNRYSFEQKECVLNPAFEKEFKKSPRAWNYFQSKPPSYRKPSIHWVMSAKKLETQLRRLHTLIQHSENETSLPQLSRKPR
jgi:uncharacterized protein YdeI (YjbR/CyaY-like superfamily)